jgi:hypothetical protein
VLTGRQILLFQVCVPISHDFSIWQRSHGGHDPDDQVGGICVTGLCQMHFITSPAGVFLSSKTGFNVGWRSDQKS